MPQRLPSRWVGPERGSRRRRVRRTTHFLDEAQGLFPLGGSPDGRPSFELFADRILRAVEELFARDFEGSPRRSQASGSQ